MNSFRKELDRRLHNSEDGVSLVEIMIAMLIFSIVSMGIVGTLIATANFSNDSRAREEATNLASQTIDAARAVPNVFNLFSNGGQQTTVDGRTFTVNMIAAWVSDPNSVAPCGAGGGALLYKRVNVTVTWPGMANKPVQQDTLIAPTTRVSDPDDATILLSTTDQNGKPVSGVSVTTIPALSPPAVATDVDGCSYLLKVPVGTYKITLSKSGYVGIDQSSVQSTTVSVVAGGSINKGFPLAQAQPLLIKNASNAVGAASLPVSMYESLVHATDPAINANALPSPLNLYPFSDGYNVFAGHDVEGSGNTSCVDANPANWAASTVLGTQYASPANQPVIPASPAPTANVRMGLVTVKGTAANQAVSAVQVGAATGADPGCALSTSASPILYNFGGILQSGKLTQLALPFGTYKLYYSTNGTGTQVGSSNMAVTVPSTNTSNVVTLDPRVVTP